MLIFCGYFPQPYRDEELDTSTEHNFFLYDVLNYQTRDLSFFCYFIF